MIITSEIVISGFISKVVNEIVDVPLNPIKNAIKNADKNRKDKNQSIETRIYQVTIDAINEFTKDKYKEQDVLYDAAESVVKGFKNSKNSNSEAVRAGLKMLVSQVTTDICEVFLGTLCYVICKEENRDLAIEVIILQQEQTNGYIQEGFNRSYLNYEEINRKLDYLIKELVDKKLHEERKVSEVPIINRADEYVQKWNENVFLNDFNEEDENAGTEIKLSEIYIEKCLPHYIWERNIKPSDKLSDLLAKYVNDKNGKKMLLILGQPGIGKSTLITWIMANLVKKKDDILVYQFANDLGSINWQGENVLNDIFKVIGLEYDEFENKTLILDGFDEIYAGGDRERILNRLEQELKRRTVLKSFSLIITCRENYIYNLQNIKCDYIVLQAWEETQIETFCRTYWGKCKKAILESKIQKIQENKEIFGIPLILYMILALDIAIEKNSSIVDVYDQIFSLEKGVIYDRCYDLEHRINLPEIKEHVYRISQKMAFWMFENNADKTFISQEKFEEICEDEMREITIKNVDIQSDTLIGNFFKLRYCEGKATDELQFVHRSIYEYFVVIYFFESIHKLKSKEEIAGKLGELLKDRHLSKQMLEFLKSKFDSMEGKYFLGIIREVFDMMLRDGMLYYFIKKYKEPLLDILVREMNIFSNMLEIIHLRHDILEYVDKKIVVYLQHNRLYRLNLGGVDLSGTNLSGAYLIRANLRRANLREANLRRANLRRANLIRANLTRADLRRADLNGADLRRADLNGAYLDGAYLIEADLREADLREADLNRAYLIEADLREADLNGADLVEADLRGANLIGTIFDERQVDILHEKYDLSSSGVILSETDEIISYQEYCSRKQKRLNRY